MKSISGSELLKKAIDLIRDPEHWTKQTMARNKFGDSEFVDSDRAVKFCMLGSLVRAAMMMPTSVKKSAQVRYRVEQAVSRKVRRLGLRSLPVFNDAEGTTHKEVIGVMSDALRELKRNEKRAAAAARTRRRNRENKEA